MALNPGCIMLEILSQLILCLYCLYQIMSSGWSSSRACLPSRTLIHGRPGYHLSPSRVWRIILVPLREAVRVGPADMTEHL